MDDFNTSVLSEAKNEYSSRLLNILTPLIIGGFKSIFKEAYDLCVKNEEDSKYLMTFQNFLTRVPKWNQEIINMETKRIVETSKCSYLEDILTCVHITQLKILTSIRVSSKQRKIDIDIPKLHDFIHKVYIESARQLYQNVYLFEKDIYPLQYQKNMRECEIIVRESILKVIRESMPIEKILRAYIDETEEEELVQEVVEKPVQEDTASEESASSKEESSATEGDPQHLEAAKSSDTDDQLVAKKSEEQDASEQQTLPEKSGAAEETATAPAASQPTSTATAAASHLTSTATATQASDVKTTAVDTKSLAERLQINIPVSMDQTATQPALVSSPVKSSSSISFSNKDSMVEYSSGDKPVDIRESNNMIISAPKTLERLEKISSERNEKRKKEEEAEEDEATEYEKIKISNESPNVSLDALDIHVLDPPLSLNTQQELSGVEVLV